MSICLFNEIDLVAESVTPKVAYVQNNCLLLVSPPSSQEGKSSFPAPRTCSGLEAGIACSPGDGEQGGRAVSRSQPMRREEADYQPMRREASWICPAPRLLIGRRVRPRPISEQYSVSSLFYQRSLSGEYCQSFLFLPGLHS